MTNSTVQQYEAQAQKAAQNYAAQKKATSEAYFQSQIATYQAEIAATFQSLAPTIEENLLNAFVAACGEELAYVAAKWGTTNPHLAAALEGGITGLESSFPDAQQG